MSTKTIPCAECAGCGWLLLFNADTAALEVQRCDSCCRFASDEEAQVYIASHDVGLVEVLAQYCCVLLSDARRALHEESDPQRNLEEVLQSIRDSLANAARLFHWRAQKHLANGGSITGQGS